MNDRSSLVSILVAFVLFTTAGPLGFFVYQAYFEGDAARGEVSASVHEAQPRAESNVGLVTTQHLVPAAEAESLAPDNRMPRVVDTLRTLEQSTILAAGGDLETSEQTELGESRATLWNSLTSALGLLHTHANLDIVLDELQDVLVISEQSDEFKLVTLHVTAAISKAEALQEVDVEQLDETLAELFKSVSRTVLTSTRTVSTLVSEPARKDAPQNDPPENRQDGFFSSVFQIERKSSASGSTTDSIGAQSNLLASITEARIAIASGESETFKLHLDQIIQRLELADIDSQANTNELIDQLKSVQSLDLSDGSAEIRLALSALRQ